MTGPRAADHITALAGSADLSRFAPFLSSVMFFFNENSLSAGILIGRESRTDSELTVVRLIAEGAPKRSVA